MHRISKRLPSSHPTTRERLTLELAFDKRQKSRFRAALSDGSECAVALERGGASLRDGDLLETDEGVVIEVKAQPETVSVATASEALTLCKAAYHLGNRHVALQVDAGRLTYLHDHVLDDMVRGLGLRVDVAEVPFEPESGAYGDGHAHIGGGHAHGKGRIHQHHAHEHHTHEPHAHHASEAHGHSHGPILARGAVAPMTRK